MTSDTSQFDVYYEELSSLLKQLALATPDESTALVSQGRDLLQQLALEARSVLDTDLKRELLEAVKQANAQLRALEYEHQKASLVTSSSNHRQCGASLRENEATLARQNETLERARHTMRETENVGKEISTELSQNRETIESTHGKVNEFQSMTSRASELLKSMSKPWWRR
jgi:methyl-accepting chemotaxis protein